MKGTLHKLSKGWTIWYNDDHIGGNVSFVDSLPLHPDDVKEINELSKIFDNVDARYNGQEVEFEMTYHWDETIPQPISVGRLIKTKEDDKDGSYETVNDVEKLAAKHYPQFYKYSLGRDRIGFERGYNLAKEMLYTEEQVRELLYYYNLEIKKHLLSYPIEHSLHSKMCDGINDVRNTYIQSLKQPKKDI
jgi:hypothetical protein